VSKEHLKGLPVSVAFFLGGRQRNSQGLLLHNSRNGGHCRNTFFTQWREEHLGMLCTPKSIHFVTELVVFKNAKSSLVLCKGKMVKFSLCLSTVP
jgi:hypothetical protein